MKARLLNLCHIFSVLTVIFLLSSCTSNSTASLDSETSSENIDDFGNEDTTSSESVANLIERTFNFNVNQATTFVLFKDSLRAEAETETNPLPNAIETNFWILSDTSELLPAVSYATENIKGTLRLNVDRIDVAPSGEVYLLLDRSAALINQENTCRLFVMHTDRSFSCVDPDLENDFEVFQVEFTQNGDAYFASLDGRIRRYEALTGVAAEIFNGAGINFDLNVFLPSPHGGLLLNGNLNETAQEFFHYDTLNLTLNAECPRALSVSSKYELKKGEVFLASSGKAYISSESTVCPELDLADAYRLEKNGEHLEYTALTVQQPVFFAEDSLKTVYAAVNYEDEQGTKLIEADNSAFTVTTSVVETEMFAVELDQILSAGYDANGDYLFVKKDLLPPNDETVILSGFGKIVQAFSATPDGILLSATDLFSGEQALYFYDNASQTLRILTPIESEITDLTPLI